MNTVSIREMINKKFSHLKVAQLNLLHNPEGFEKRLQTLFNELEGEEIDFLCLQEVLVDTRHSLEKVLARLGFISSAYGGTVSTKNGLSGNAIFSKHVNTWYEFIDFSSLNLEYTIPVVVARSNVFGVDVHVMSAHLVWGGSSEHLRLRQATALTAYAEKVREENSGAVVVAAGDFNAMEDNSTIRYLTGKQENHLGLSTYWVDSYKVHGRMEDWVTSDPQTFWGLKTAYGVGILHPELIPSRRIDYVLSYGWCYGRPGSPLSFKRFGTVLTGDEFELSDHYGLIVDILVK